MTKCMYCEKPGKVVCDTCHDLKESAVLHMTCPDCFSIEVLYDAANNSWLCPSCKAEWGWLW